MMQGVYLLRSSENPFVFKVGMSNDVDSELAQVNRTSDRQWEYVTHIDGCSWAIEQCILDDLSPLQLDTGTFACSENYIRNVFKEYRNILNTGMLSTKKPRSIYTISEQIRRDDAKLKNYDKYYIALRLGRYFKTRPMQVA
ncbi:hypothetical protein ACPV51_01090 [Vibrio astriarenae]|jgi:hypothetical protein